MDSKHSIQNELRTRLKDRGFSDVEILEVPQIGDRRVRLQTLEEILDEMEQGKSMESVQYIVRAKKTPAIPLKTADEDIHLPNGKLNTRFLFKNAEVLVDAKEIAPARSILEAILKTGEEMPRALIALSRCDEAEGKIDEAIQKLQLSITYEPTATAYQRIVELEISRGNTERAGEIVSRAFRSKDTEKSDMTSLHSVAIDVWEKLGRLHLVVTHAEALLAADPLNIPIRLRLAHIHLRQGDWARAEKNAQEILRRFPANASALAVMGHIQMTRGDLSKAYDLLSRSLEIDIQNPSAIFELVRCAYQAKRYSKAADLLQRYVERNPAHPDLIYSLAGLHFHLGRFTEAKKMALQVLDMKSGHPGSLQLLQLIDRVV